MGCSQLDCMAARRVGRVTIDQERRLDSHGDREIRSLRVWSELGMSRHNPVASRRRRLTYVAKIKRDEGARAEGRTRCQRG